MPTYRGLGYEIVMSENFSGDKKQGEKSKFTHLASSSWSRSFLWFSCVIQSAERYYLRKYEVRSRVATMDLLPVFLT